MPEAYTHRDRLARVTGREGVCAILACAPENILYTTGYAPFQGPWNRTLRAAVVGEDRLAQAVVLPLAEIGFAVDQALDQRFEIFPYGAPNLSVPADVELAADEARIADIADRRLPDAISAIVAAIAHAGISAGERIAVDTETSSLLAEILSSAETPWSFTPGGEALLREIRMVKTPAEVELLRRAAEVNELGVRAAQSRIGSDADDAVSQAHRREVTAYGAVVQHWQGSFGRRAGAYRQPVGRRAVLGDRFVFDAGIVLDGYCADTGGTFQIGKPPTADERRTWEALTAGVHAMIDSTRPGTRVSELYDAGIAAIRAGGASDYRYSLLGHGIGLEPRDFPIIGPPSAAPWLSSGEPFDPELEPDMVLNFETPIIALGIGGFQHEVTIRVTRGEPELLSGPREYVVI
jgi:Xaa-Pro dipeptidase